MINFLYRKVEYINGLGSFEDPQTVRVRDKAGKEVSSVCGVAIGSGGRGGGSSYVNREHFENNVNF